MRTISGKTSLVGLLGSPVRHSLSPVIHNAAFNEMGLDWCYLAIPCKPTNLRNIANALKDMDCKGLNITIPHKEKAIDLCAKTSDTAKRIGAINTLIKNKEGNWEGENTDIEGFIAPLKEITWTNKNVILIGCGGSARAVIEGLKRLSFKRITIIGRNESKLKTFTNNISKKDNDSIIIEGISQKDINLIEYIKNADLVVNATPIGMSNTNLQMEMPLGTQIWNHLRANTTLYDLIYNPRPTPWLENCAKINCNQIDGLEMLIHQGAASLKLWSGFNEIPIETMKKAALNYLGL